MPCIDANDGEFNPTKLVPKPACHRARLKADTLRQWRMFTKQLGQIAGIRLGLSFKNRLTSLVDYAHRSLSLRDIQSDVLPPDSSSESLDCENSTITQLPPTSADRNYVIVFKFDPRIASSADVTLMAPL